MAQLIFPSGAIASTTLADISTIKIKKDIGKAAIATTSIASIGSVRRWRNSGKITANCTSMLAGTIKRKLNLPAGAIATTTSAAISFFLTEEQAPPPTGKLFIAGNAFAGSRLVKGDLIPINFTISGQRLAGLNAVYTAKRKDLPSAPALIKTSIHQTDPVINPLTGIESVLGSFYLDSADTSGYPDSEVELSYTFKLADGLGRVYTLESGIFTVYTP